MHDVQEEHYFDDQSQRTASPCAQYAVTLLSIKIQKRVQEKGSIHGEWSHTWLSVNSSIIQKPLCILIATTSPV
jgi:hypothetical protein